MPASCCDLDLLGQRHARLVGDDRLAELVDEAVALDQQGRHAERQIELGGGEALGPVLPADVIHRHLRAVHDDALDIVGPNGCRACIVRMASSVVWLEPTQE